MTSFFQSVVFLEKGFRLVVPFLLASNLATDCTILHGWLIGWQGDLERRARHERITVETHVDDAGCRCPILLTKLCKYVLAVLVKNIKPQRLPGIQRHRICHKRTHAL